MCLSFIVFYFISRWWPICVWLRREWTRVYLCSTKYRMWPRRFRMKLVSHVLSEALGQLGGGMVCCNNNEVKWKQWWNLHMCQTANTSHFPLCPRWIVFLISDASWQKAVVSLRKRKHRHKYRSRHSLSVNQLSETETEREVVFFFFSVRICEGEFNAATLLASSHFYN